MNKKVVIWIAAVAVLLGCIGTALFLHQRENLQLATYRIDSLAHPAYGVSLNLKEFIEGTENVREVALSGAMTYYNTLTQDLIPIHEYGTESDWFINLESALDLARIRFKSVYDRFLADQQISSEDHAFLVCLKNAMDTLLDSLKNEDGTLKWAVLDPQYFTDTINRFSFSLRECTK